LRSILANVGNSEVTNEILELWLEYEEESSLEGKVAHQLDKFEMILQADEYEKANPAKTLHSFFKSTTDSFVHPEVGVATSSLLRTFIHLRRYLAGHQS
jgi:putative hydrolase of HD superfamily